MNVRDFDYIEARLMDTGPAAEACGRLKQVGRPDLADRVMKAAQEYTDALREIRMEIQGQRGTK
jgi:hypothetical protein